MFVSDYDEGEITSSSDSDTESCTNDNAAGGATVPNKKPSTEGKLKSVVVVPDDKKAPFKPRIYEKEGVTTSNSCRSKGKPKDSLSCTVMPDTNCVNTTLCASLAANT